LWHQRSGFFDKDMLVQYSKNGSLVWLQNHSKNQAANPAEIAMHRLVKLLFKGTYDQFLPTIKLSRLARTPDDRHGHHMDGSPRSGGLHTPAFLIGVSHG
jgi:hypothetical protein